MRTDYRKLNIDGTTITKSLEYNKTKKNENNRKVLLESIKSLHKNSLISAFCHIFKRLSKF